MRFWLCCWCDYGSTCGLGTPTGCLGGICGAVIGGDADGDRCCRGGGRNRKTKRKGKKGKRVKHINASVKKQERKRERTKKKKTKKRVW